MRGCALSLSELTTAQYALARSNAVPETVDGLAGVAETIRVQLFGAAIVAEEGQPRDSCAVQNVESNSRPTTVVAV
jgi:hypothetical protein